MTSLAKKQKSGFPHRHLLSCEKLTVQEINCILDLADKAADQNRKADKRRDVLAGRTLINLFYESSTRTQSSFELAAKRLGADVMNMVALRLRETAGKSFRLYTTTRCTH